MEKINEILSSSKLTESDKNKVKRCLTQLLSIRSDIKTVQLSLTEDNLDAAVDLLEECFFTICCSISNESWSNPDELYNKIQQCLNEPLTILS